MLKALLRKHTEKRRLFELHRQPLAERSIEDGVGRAVVEVADHDRVSAEDWVGG
jgi:hypothetical protein